MAGAIRRGLMGVMGALAALGACSSDDSRAPEASLKVLQSKLVQAPVVAGNVTTLAGNGTPGANDAPVATNGTLNDPSAVAATPDGAIYIADRGNNSIRRIKPDGSLDTFLKGQPNLIKDPGAEVYPYPSPWSTTSGWWPMRQCTDSSCPPTQDGVRYFGGGSMGINTLVAAIDVSAYASTIAAGKQKFHFSGYMRVGTDSAQIVVDYVNAAGTSLSKYDTGPKTGLGAWTEFVDDRVAPTATAKINVSLVAISGSAADNAYFDTLELRAMPTAPVGENLLKNSGGEAFPYTEWNATNGTWPVRDACPAPGIASCPPRAEGARYFGGSETVASLVQMVDVSPFATTIAAGTQKFKFSGVFRTAQSDTAEFHVEYVNAANQVVGAYYSGLRQSTNAWMEVADERFAPTTTTKVGIWMVGRTTTPQQMVFFDGLNFRALPVAGAPAPNDALLIEPKSLATKCTDPGTGIVCMLYIAAANGLFTANTSDGTIDRVQPIAGYFPPNSASSVSIQQDGTVVVGDGVSGTLHVGQGNNWHYAALPPQVGSVLSVATSGVGAQNLWTILADANGNTGHQVRGFSCPPSPTHASTVACNFFTNGPTGLPTFGMGVAGFVDDIDGIGGDERLSFPSVLTQGQRLPNLNGPIDVFVSENGNSAIRRHYSHFTRVLTGTGTAGFLDAAAAQAKFNLPGGAVVMPDSSLVIADRGNNRIRKVGCGAATACFSSLPPNPIPPMGACGQLSADDANSCTTDTCEVIAIRHTNLPTGAACNDGNGCTAADTCNASAMCQPGPPVATNDNDNCTVDSCDAATGVVSHTPKTFTDNDPTDCLAPKCNPADGSALYVSVAEATPCGAANSNRFCDAVGTCEAPALALPVTIPPLDASTGTPFDSLTGPIWNNGSQSLQTSIASNKLEPGHGGWLIGQVKTAAGRGLPNVTVSVAGDAGYGSTKTRGDGRFDLVVNGGKSHIIRFSKDGHLPADRQVYVGWEETSNVPEVTLLTADPNPTLLAFNGNTGTTTFQVATGSKSTDDDGVRTGQLMIPVGTKAMVGSIAQQTLNLRITEYTVGVDGPARMPAALPPTSAYTYAVELAADNLANVTFTKPVYYYVENFINADPGTAVPSGYYDRDLRTWVASENGLVIKVLKGQSLNGSGPAKISINLNDDEEQVLTDPSFANLNFTNDELLKVAMYPDGTTLWRIPIAHMTSWDFNLGFSDTCGSTCKNPYLDVSRAQHMACETNVAGSIIGCETQSLGETVPVAGTPFSLNYNSSRMPLYSNWRTLRLGVQQFDTSDVDSSKSTILVTIAGKVVYQKESGGLPPRYIDVRWDGRDAYGRGVVGGATATVEGRWWGKKVFLESVPYFGASSSRPKYVLVRRLRPFSYEGRNTFYLETNPPPVDEGTWLLGGWTLSAHHFYDPKGGVLYLGSGQTRVTGQGLYTVTRIAGSGGSGTTFAANDTSATAEGTGIYPNTTVDVGVAVGPNGDVYYVDASHYVVRRINAQGQVKTIAGTGSSNNCSGPRGDGGDALLGTFYQPSNLALGRDGELYVTDYSEGSIRVLRPTGIPDKWTIDTVAGSKVCAHGVSTHDVPALDAVFSRSLNGLAVGVDGYVYVGDRGNSVIRRFLPGGKIYTVAGKQGVGEAPILNGQPATTVGLGAMQSLAVGPDGSIYTDSNLGRNLWRIGPDGIFNRLSASYVQGDQVDEGVSSSTEPVDSVAAIAVTPDGNVIFNHEFGGSPFASYVRSIAPTGIVQSISKSNGKSPVDGAAAMQNGPVSVRAIATAPDGATIVFAGYSIYRISTGTQSSASLCNDARTAHLIPSGDEAYCFDKTGRHLSTVNWRTRKALWTFEYASSHIKITDGNNQLVDVLYSPNGEPPNFTITAPNKQTTVIGINESHNATSIVDLLGMTTLHPTLSGRLDSLVDRNGNTSKFQFFDDDGRLSSDQSPLSETGQKLLQSFIPGGYRVTHTTPLLRTTTYDVTTDAAGTRSTLVTLPDSTAQKTLVARDGTTTVTSPDGTKVVTTLGPDPVMGARSAFPTKTEITLPGQTKPTLTSSTAVCPPTLSSGITTQYSATAWNATVACNSKELTDPLSNKPSQTPAFINPTHATLKRESSTTGETLTSTSAEGRTSVVTLDAQGRTTSVKLGNLTPTLFNYVTPGHPEQLSSISRGARSTTLAYRDLNQVPDPDAGYVKSITTPASTTAFTRDIFGRVLTQIEAQGVIGQEAATSLGWDANGNLNLVKPPGRPNHGLLSNAINGLDTYTPPALTGVAKVKTTYTTDGDRAAVKDTLPDDVTITRNYTTTPANSGKLDTVEFTGRGTLPAGTLSFGYYLSTENATGQAPGRLKSISGPYSSSNVLTFTYNGSRTTGISWAGDVTGSITWGYDAHFLPSSETVSPGASAVYLTRDKDDLVTCISQTQTSTCSAATLPETDLKLDRSTEVGVVKKLTAGSVVEEIDYSDTATDSPNGAFGELRHQKITFGNTVLAEFTYDASGERRDDLGRITFKTETIQGTSHTYEYEYDERNRLERVFKDTIDPNTPTESFGYDTNGNRISYGGPTGTVSSTTYDDQDRMKAYGSTTITYGANGEMTGKTVAGELTTYAYDALGNLVTVTPPSPGATITYLYDGLNRRIGKKVGSTLIKRWIYRDSLYPVAEIDGTNNKLVARYVFGSRPNIPDLVIRPNASGTANTTYRLIADHVGSPRLAIEVTAGTVAYRADYSAFGEATPGVGTSLDWVPFGFAGGLYDKDTGLVRFGARDYDPQTGRWTSKDPILFSAGQSNLYVYAGNDPIGNMDPDGLLVDVTFDRATGHVLVKDRDTGESATYDAYSGGNPYGDPIPTGWYEVLSREGKDNYWRLDAVDSAPRNDWNEPANRGLFRLHGPGRSLGCVTAKDGRANRANWLKAASIINRTKTVMVADNRNWWRTPQIQKYGDLIVK
jgi:RHS repeat-associated protein